MSDKDLVAQAALRALSRPSDNAPVLTKKSSITTKASVSKKSKIPEKGSAEAEAHRQAALATQSGKGGDKAKKPSSPSTPKDNNGSGLGFLFLVLAVPLAVVGGLFGYADMQQNTDKSTVKNTVKTTNSAKMNTPKTLTNGGPQTPSAPVAKQGLQNPLRAKIVRDHKPSASTLEQNNTKIAAVTPKSTGTSVNAAPKTAAKVDPKTGKTADQTSWDYKSTDWAAIDPSFKTCGEGRSQSPINIVARTQQAGPNFFYNYQPSNGKVHNNGHSVQVDLNKGNRLLVNGKSYDLVQFHFHTPSENALNGKHAPMEVHLVHKNQHNQLVVVAVMIYGDGANQLIDHMPVPETKGAFVKSNGAHINPLLLLPNNRRSFTFSGSLTTPPCTQNVGWIVMQQPLGISPATLAKFTKVLGKNNRPVQAANNRSIYTSY